MIEVNHIVKQYGIFRAVDDLSFSIGGNRIYGFLGPNGAGKSTTMNIITGYLSATSGTVTVDGFDVFLQPEETKSRIGYLPEIPPVYLDMTIQEYLRFAAKLKKIPKAQITDEVQRAIAAADLAPMGKRLIKYLSKGYRQRVGIACMLLGNPPYLIMDEPTVGLDPKQIKDIMDLIRSLGKEHTILLSSHILPEISALCDEILILRGGKMVAGDTPKNLGKQTRKSNVYHMQVKGTKETVRGALSKVKSLRSLQMEPNADGLITVRLETIGTESAYEEIFGFLAEAGCPLAEFRCETVSLEDVFLKLTENGEASDAIAAEKPEETK